MAKQKTHKATSKRISISKTGKILKRKAGHGHFNAKESGKVRRNKRRDVELTPTHKRRIIQALPYQF